MSSGAVHDKASLWAGMLSGMCLLLWEPLTAALLWGLSFVLGALWLSPDLDMPTSNPTKRWGPLKLLWRPYSKTHKHRGLSHNILIGPAVRILYLLVLCSPVVLWFFNWKVAAVVSAVQPYDFEVLVICASIYASNCLHLVMDGHLG